MREQSGGCTVLGQTGVRLPVKMAVWVGAALPPLTATLKLQLNHRTTILGSRLRSGPTEVLPLGTHREATPRLVGGVEMWNGLVPHSCVVAEHWEEGLNCGVPP